MVCCDGIGGETQLVTSWNGAADPAVELAQLREALVTQPVIEQAKGMIMVLRRSSPEEAFATLREISQCLNVKLRDVAAVVVAAGSQVEQLEQVETEDVSAVVAVLAELRRRVPGIVLGSERDNRAGVDGQVGTALPGGIARAPGERGGAAG